jgi:hypothetical protein
MSKIHLLEGRGDAAYCGVFRPALSTLELAHVTCSSCRIAEQRRKKFHQTLHRERSRATPRGPIGSRAR